MPPSRLTSLLAAVALVTAAAAPAGAATSATPSRPTPPALTPVDEHAAEVVGWVVEELVLLEEVAAFVDDPAVTQLHAWMDDELSDRSEALDVLGEVDDANADDLAVLLEEDWRPGGATRRVLSSLDEATWSRLGSGEQGFLPPAQYLHAAAELLVAAGARMPGDRVDPGPYVVEVLAALPYDGMLGLDLLAEEGVPASVARSGSERPGAPPPVGGAADVLDDVLDADGSGPGSRDESPDPGAALVVVAVCALVALLAAAVLARRRRRSGGTADDRGGAASTPHHGHGADLVIEAGRRMTAALEPSAVWQIACSTAVVLAEGDDGAVVVGRGATATWEPTAPGWAPAAPAQQPVVARVVETGQPARRTVADDHGVPVALVATPVLVDGTVGGAIVVWRRGEHSFSAAEAARLDRLTPVVGTAVAAAETHHGALTAAEVDELTRLRNRRRLDADLASIAEASRVAFAMVDVDHFKRFNDRNGHGAGDVALQLVAAAIAGAVRPADAVYRYGGEEFSVLLHGCDAGTAAEVMERVRAAVAALVVPGGEHQPAGHVTVSVGVAASEPGGFHGLFERADRALYAAKDAGRDRVVLADQDVPAS